MLDARIHKYTIPTVLIVVVGDTHKALIHTRNAENIMTAVQYTVYSSSMIVVYYLDLLILLIVLQETPCPYALLREARGKDTCIPRHYFDTVASYYVILLL